jgi:hypothetical protein
MVAVGGATLVGGVLSGQASKRAGEQQAAAGREASATQLAASREANALQWQMYQQNQQNQRPFLQGGQTAYAALMGGMGLGAPSAPTLPGAAGVPGAPAVAGPAGQQGPAASGYGPVQNYGATQEQMAGAAAQYGGPNGQGQFTQTFKPSDLTTDPSYQWRLDQGQRMIRNSQSARGLLGGSQSKVDLLNYGQGAASQEYQSMYDRFMKNQETAYGRLSGLAGMGSNTAGNLGTAGMTAGQVMGANTMSGAANSSNYLTSGVASQAAGQVGQANAWAAAGNQGVQNYMTMQYLNKFKPTQVQAHLMQPSPAEPTAY